MELSTRARYAVEAVIDLSVITEGQTNASLGVISQRVSISISYLEQLFSKLRRAGVVSSVKGPKGGYKLAKDPSKITILDIIKAVDETIETRSCKGKLDKGMGCGRNKAKCHTHNLWEDLLNGINNHLKQVTIADVIGNNRPTNNNICPSKIKKEVV